MIVLLKILDDKTITKHCGINDEFHLDIILDECVIGGLNVHHFEVDEYNSWGTPLDLENYLKDQCWINIYRPKIKLKIWIQRKC